MAAELITVSTPVCMGCSKRSSLLVPLKGYNAWRLGALIQDAFPELAPEEREQLKTGTHAACWDAMFGGLEDF